MLLQTGFSLCQNWLIHVDRLNSYGRSKSVRKSGVGGNIFCVKGLKKLQSHIRAFGRSGRAL